MFEFRLLCTGVSARFAFSSPDVARFALVFRFRFAERLSFAFELSLPLLLAGFRFGLLSFEFACEIVELLFSGFFSLSLLVLDVGVELSPSFAGRQMSTATVCPTFTIS